MLSHSALLPEYTITQEFERLSVQRPVNVWTHNFDAREPDSPPADAETAVSCGRTYSIEHRREVVVHDHEHYEISFVTGGRALHRTTMYEMEVGRGCVQIVAPGQVHGFYEIDGLHIINCAYLTEWMLNDVRELWTVDSLIPLFLAPASPFRAENPWIPQHLLTDEAFEACLQELRDIAREWEKESPSRPYLRRCLEKLMILLTEIFARDEGLERFQASHPQIQVALERIEGYISEGPEFSVAALAGDLGLTPNYFSRLFKNATGLSPMAYFQNRRIQHAAWLLLNTHNSITETAYSLGFRDPAHFCRLFKRHLGASPRAYRQRYNPSA